MTVSDATWWSARRARTSCIITARSLKWASRLLRVPIRHEDGAQHSGEHAREPDGIFEIEPTTERLEYPLDHHLRLMGRAKSRRVACINQEIVEVIPRSLVLRRHWHGGPFR